MGSGIAGPQQQLHHYADWPELLASEDITTESNCQ